MAGQTGLQPILARQLPFWDRLTPRERALVLERSGMVHYDPGQNIRGRSMECVGTLLVQQGSLRIYLLSDEGREVTVYRVGPGEICILAAACVLDGIDFDMQIDAEEACEAIFLAFLEVLGQGIRLDGNYVDIELGEVEWVDKEDSILKANIACQIPVTFHGGIYRDDKKKTASVGGIRPA